MNTPKQVAENYLSIAQAKANLPALKTLVLGIFAGMFIAFAAVGSAAAAATVKTASIAKFVTASIFPAGLAMVLVSGSELFTGNCLLFLPLAARKIRLSGMLKNWMFVYLGNLIGSVLVAFLCAYGGVFSLFGGEFAAAVVNTASAKAALSFTDAFVKGILCNFLVCIAVWMSFASRSAGGKVVALFFPILLFVVSGFEHSVANMYYIPAGLFAKCVYPALAEGQEVLTWTNFFFANLVPVTLGNIAGGGAVAMGYWFSYLKGEKI